MKHLFFDLDRTLWDFERNSETALRQLFDELKLNQLIKSFEGFHQSYKTHNARLWNRYGKGKITKEELRSQRFRDTLQQYQIFNSDLVNQMSDGYIEISPKQTHVFPNTHQILDELKCEGYKMHIITNGFKEVQFTKLEMSKLASYFDFVLCSEEVGKSKPHPDVFNYAIKSTGADKKESVMIGDDLEVDVLGAIHAGMEGILFNPRKQYKIGAHDWEITDLNQLPATLFSIKNSRLI